MIIEERIKACLVLLRDVCWRQTSDIEYMTNDMLAWLEGGVKQGYSTFLTYKQTYQIYDIIRNDIAIALTSNDPFIRILAEKIYKESVDIPRPFE